MSSSISIRQLHAGDAVLLQELNRVFKVAFDDDPDYSSAPPSAEYLEKLLSRDTFFAVTAMDESGKIVGGLTAYELLKTEQERSEIYLYDLAVLSEFRRQGVATRLIRELQLIGGARSAYVIFVQADDGDLPASALYDKLGIRESVHHFDIEVIRG